MLGKSIFTDRRTNYPANKMVAHMQSVGYPIWGDKCNAFRGGDFFFFVELNLHNGEYFWFVVVVVVLVHICCRLRSANKGGYGEV